jgi:hypothetical protein
MMLSEELGKLKELHDEGAISDTEYATAKDRLLNKSNALASLDHPNTKDLLGMTPSTYAMVMHLSQYATYIVPVVGGLVPIAMWVYGRDQNEFVNKHGQDLMNFLISYIIYVTVAVILCFVAVGLILLPILILATLILPIFGAIAASKSQNYRYPLTIKFF